LNQNIVQQFLNFSRLQLQAKKTPGLMLAFFLRKDILLVALVTKTSATQIQSLFLAVLNAVMMRARAASKVPGVTMQ
jgi:hypothetical protein